MFVRVVSDEGLSSFYEWSLYSLAISFVFTHGLVDNCSLLYMIANYSILMQTYLRHPLGLVLGQPSHSSVSWPSVQG